MKKGLPDAMTSLPASPLNHEMRWKSFWRRIQSEYYDPAFFVHKVNLINIFTGGQSWNDFVDSIMAKPYIPQKISMNLF